MRGKSEDLKDEVYRQMFRLEENRACAEMSLALALLRAWAACGSKHESCEERKWLETISPICLAMIETALRAGGTAHSCSR
jgi:hypothetical protein